MIENKLILSLFIIATPILQIIGPMYLIEVDRIDHEGIATGLAFLFTCVLWVVTVFIASLIVGKFAFKKWRYGLAANIPLFGAALVMLSSMADSGAFS
ncbi:MULTISPECIES: hypothetical protein [unclassified Shewanella]|uniref:hypothetical protein n=1 Tax=unclassified Shewanella TaxID=196818 RepID=UPI0021537B28|nr:MULTISPECIES: hypothetical protein [unclassified Shewanella]